MKEDRKGKRWFDNRFMLLLWYLPVLLAVFLIEKPLFMLYAGGLDRHYRLADWLAVMWHGFSIDLSVTSYLILLPLLAVLVSTIWQKLPLKKILLAYNGLVSLLLSLIFIGDAALYPFWDYKLDASVFMYLKTPQEALASVSAFMAVLGIVLVLAAASGLFLLLSLPLKPLGRKLDGPVSKWGSAVFYVILVAPLVIAIRGGVKESTMNVGHAYFSEDQFLNHSAVNPGFSLLSSLSKTSDYSTWYEYLPEDRRAAIADSLLVQNDGVTRRLLDNTRPNVLLLVMEGFGADFIGQLGGEPRCSGNLDRIILESVFFDSCYAGSFRTDRGLVCVMNGHPGLPSVSVMKMPVKSAKLPSVARSLAESGYSTQFIYGGDINFTNMNSWLFGNGFQSVVSDKDFSQKEQHSNAWGANDEYTFARTLDELRRKPSGKPWFVTVLSLSSHEPWQVPSQSIDDVKLNAFAYTDSCVGAFVDSLKCSPLWDNMLLLITSDHGHRFFTGDHPQAPHVHHIPLVITGGAVKAEPERIGTIISQSDIAATLLSQLELPHDGFRFSRDVLSDGYDSHWAYYSFNNGFCFMDSTGFSLFDADADASVMDSGQFEDGRIMCGKALTQTYFDDLESR